MTERKTPPPGKTWVTVEMDTELYDNPLWSTLVGSASAPVVKDVKGSKPETDRERAMRLLGESASRFERASAAFRDATLPMSEAPARLARGASSLADALKALQEVL